MMTENELKKWFEENNITPAAQEIINQIRSSEPSRKVQSGKNNVSGFYPSRKMGMTIQFESHTVELPAIYEMEYDSSVYEYYDQPKQVFMEYLSESGRKISVNSTPDFFIISKDGAGWEEWKTEEELVKLSIKSPNRFIKGKDGIWRCPPGERYASKFGLTYLLRSSKETNWIFQRNIRLLEEYIKKSYLREISEEKLKVAKEIVLDNFGITFKELIDSNSLLDTETIYVLIANQILYADIRNQILIEQEIVQIFIDSDMAKIYHEIFTSSIEQYPIPNIQSVGLTVGSKFLWDDQEYTILNYGVSTITAVDKKDRLVNLTENNMRILLKKNVIKVLNNTEILNDSANEYRKNILEGASRLDIEEAYKRYEIIIQEDCENHGYSSKTISRWKKAYKEAQKLYGNGFLGLVPRKKKRGNRNKKIDNRVVSVITEIISKYYLTKKQINMRAAYELLEVECKNQDLSCPSYVTFTKYINKKPGFDKEMGRKGKRAAYNSEHWYLEQHTPKHGDMPFEIAHIDHTELDIELVLNNGLEKNTYRPYLTLLIDAYSRVILAHYITFDPPSFRSNMMVMRECVRRNNQLPRTLVVDGGKEFHSVYFDSLCAQFEIVKKTRPPAQARFGSVIERLFGTTNTKFIHNLQGNTQITKEIRKVTKSVNPKNHAIWTLSRLDEMFYQWIEYYHSVFHKNLGSTPMGKFKFGLERGGRKRLSYINYDESFILATLPATPRGRGLIQIGKGVVFNNIWYWNNEFSAHERKTVELKYDPFDVSVLYAFVNKRWIKCISDYHYLLKGKTYKELQRIAEETRVKLNKKKISSRDIAMFIQSIEKTESVIKQSLKDEENQRVKKESINREDVNTKGLFTNKKIDLTNSPTFDVYED
ncbi:DDE-type integrase/transposase/recombinase [Bacillus cereus]|nr:DDE-type integrase/transposase/recombinase [Bacillus cereus]